jgi:hypothetical protein
MRSPKDVVAHSGQIIWNWLAEHTMLAVSIPVFVMTLALALRLRGRFSAHPAAPSPTWD